MQYTPKTDEQLREQRGIWAAGRYKFKILGAFPKKSQSGNEMIKLVIDVYNGDKRQTINDFLMTIPKMEYKFKHAANACGLLAEYENGTLKPHHFKDKEGELWLSVQKNEKYGEQNSVNDYVKREDSPVQDNTAQVPLPDDELPF